MAGHTTGIFIVASTQRDVHMLIDMIRNLLSLNTINHLYNLETHCTYL